MRFLRRETCVVHCAAGVSRSAGVVLGLHIVKGWKLPENFWKTSTPQPRACGLIVRTALKNDPSRESSVNAITEARKWAGREPITS
jgi:hypothetical protein